jgi:hypothetical protein
MSHAAATHPAVLVLCALVPLAAVVETVIWGGVGGDLDDTEAILAAFATALGASALLVLIRDPAARRAPVVRWEMLGEGGAEEAGAAGAGISMAGYEERFAAPCALSRWASRGLVLCALLGGTVRAANRPRPLELALGIGCEAAQLLGALLFVSASRYVYARASLLVKAVKVGAVHAPGQILRAYDGVTLAHRFWGERFGADALLLSLGPYLVALLRAALHALLAGSPHALALPLALGIARCALFGLCLARINARAAELPATLARTAPDPEDLAAVSAHLEAAPLRANAFGVTVTHSLLLKLAVAAANVLFPLLPIADIRAGIDKALGA